MNFSDTDLFSKHAEPKDKEVAEIYRQISNNLKEVANKYGWFKLQGVWKRPVFIYQKTNS